MTDLAQPSSVRLPAVKFDPQGRRRVDLRAVIALALPLFINSSIQALLNLTDTWFIGRLSTDATAAVGASYWFVIVAILFFGGPGLAVQTLAAQAFGAGDNRSASRAAWAGVRGTLLVAPAFVVIALLGPSLIGVLRIDPHVAQLAGEFWLPRLLGGAFAVGIWGTTGFFNGIGRTRITLALMTFVALLNAVLNQLFIFELGWGIAGSGWATTAAMAAGLLVSIVLITRRGIDIEFGSRSTWRESRAELGRLFNVGFPIGLFPAIDVAGLAAFQAMQVAAGAVDGASTQIVMMLTSIAYLPTMGFALAGTTLVGQSIGAGDKDWANKVGNATITDTREAESRFDLATAQEIGAINKRIHAWHRSCEESRRLEEIPGIGPIVATALVAEIGDWKQFRSGRSLAAWIGLVPKQHSTGGKDRLGSITTAAGQAKHWL